MSDGGEEEPSPDKTKDEEEAEAAAKKEAKKKIPPPKKGTKNDRGDYVVTTIDIPDMRTGLKDNKEKLLIPDSDSDSGYDDEDDKKEE